jgi:hypothetical protein
MVIIIPVITGIVHMPIIMVGTADKTAGIFPSTDIDSFRTVKVIHR